MILLSWKYWAFAVVAATINCIFAKFLGWPFVAGLWVGIFAVTNERLFIGKKEDRK